MYVCNFYFTKRLHYEEVKMACFAAFWPFVKKHLTKHEQERYAVLKHIWTDIGRGRAWLRSALNERSLER